MEILQAFPISNDIKNSLNAFRSWIDGFDPKQYINDEINSEENMFHKKRRSARTRWVLPKDFPAGNVLNSYLNPVVHKSKEKPSWGVPDLDGLRVFCSRTLGWEYHETDELLLPILKKMENRTSETRLGSFLMTYRDEIKFAKVHSKRLREVVADKIQRKKCKPDDSQTNKKTKLSAQSN